MTEINLSKNCLQHFHAACHLQFVHELDLSNNCLTDCSGFELMPRLEVINLKHNGWY